MFTTVSLFVGERNIPNRTNTDISDRIQYFIDKYEPKCLEGILGYELYKALKATVPITEQRLVNLFNGIEYTDDNDKLQKWVGLQKLIVDYIYSEYMRDSTLQTTGFGVVVKKADMAVNFSPSEKICDSYNCFSRTVKSMVAFLTTQDNSLVYPEFTGTETCYALSFSRPINTFGI